MHSTWVALLSKRSVFYNLQKHGIWYSSAGTAELHLSGLIGTASNPDMQKIRIIGVFFEIGYIGCLKFGCYYLQHVPASKPFDQPDLKF